MQVIPNDKYFNCPFVFQDRDEALAVFRENLSKEDKEKWTNDAIIKQLEKDYCVVGCSVGTAGISQVIHQLAGFSEHNM